ncbi:MAG: gluconeogenesis factor YvcK family protein, partial [bacterium]
FIRMAYERARRKRGPKIVAIGGGTGLPNLLTGLKEYTDNLTAVVTVADDGGSSGRLRRQFRMLPPGDFRNCLVALADAEPLMGRLFQHRFSRKGELQGHTFGNIFLTALAEVSGDFSHALVESSRVLAVRGRVVPVTLDLVTLAARLKDGRTVRGESRIAAAGSPIDHVQLVPARVRANPDAVKAIARADILVFGPGSLYTSVVPNLLVPEIPEAAAKARAVKVYVCNIMTEPGETDGYSAGDHIAALQRYLGPRGLNGIVVNVEPPSARQMSRYHAEGAELIPLDEERLRALGVAVIRARLLAADRQYIRHDPVRLSRAVVKFAVM